MESTSRIRQATVFQARAAQSGASQVPTVQQSPVQEPLKARVVTRSLGVRLGGFGVDYTSRRVVVDPGPGQAGDQAQAQAAAKALAEAAARQAGAERVFEADWSDPTPEFTPAPDHPDPVWRRGLRAYAKARDMLRADAASSRRQSLAVA
ncbi:hypothetical protein NNJEOMEG_02558 [Fundidesulfovibrio magnetotacticus]|uniref:Uncharacterized protein n=1 Tax=Fundidesulfovibrio magnetotacticus TaxID=2730080 RepID=A0A6V8LVU4_9BACT|nr:hypothetical protein [Fundidesulfovibrio magnetotacticus]GFK94711.1 hypothetical protein NNJEOMEG_02558 [Fundidesulfovibrio magnetotacticus]